MMAKQQVRSRRKIINPVFHLQTKREDNEQLTKGMIKQVRKTGQLNLSGRSLGTVPDGIFTMYELGNDAVASFDMSKGTDDPWWTHQPLNYLDLSSNVLVNIPPDISIFQDLTVLNLQDNNLTVLPPEIGFLGKLTKLNVSHNKLRILPKELYQLTELHHLTASYNCLEKLQDEFVDLVMLQYVDISNNVLTQLPTGIGYLVRVQEFNISNNKLLNLPIDISGLRGLLKLDVTHNNLTGLPNMNEMRRLQILYAQHNDIETLPLFEGCEGLRELYLGNNFIAEVSVELCENLPLLKILDLRDNKIARLPDKIAMLQHLMRLDLSNNELEDLPHSLGLLSSLQNLQIEGNKFRSVRQDLLKAGTVRLLKHFRDMLDGEENAKLNTSLESSFVPEVRVYPDKFMMKNSRAINLGGKDINAVPDNVFQEAAEADVHVVDLSKNKFVSVPSGLKLVGECTSELKMSSNRIKQIPPFISDFTRLQYLDLGRNQLSELPELKPLENLRELVLSFNRFSEIPTTVYDLVNLEIILISDNQISDLNAEGLSKLVRLATLDLTNNNINRLPCLLGNMKQLRSLELKGNCFRVPNYSVLEQGTESVLAYLRNRIPQ